MRIKLLCAATVCTLTLGGCASVTDYSDSVTRLNTALNTAATSIEAIDTNVTARTNQNIETGIINNEYLLTTADNECAAGTQNCSLVVLSRTQKTTAYPLQSSIPKAIKALDLLKAYIANLQAIVDADTVSQVNNSVHTTLGSLDSIATQLSQESPGAARLQTRIAAYEEPAEQLIKWVVTKYVERAKVKALATATRNAQPVVSQLSVLYATAEDSVVLSEFAQSQKTFIAAQEQYDDATTQSATSIKAYVSAAAEYNGALHAQSSNPLTAFVTAHEALEQQLNGNKKFSLANVAAAISDLETEVSEVQSLAAGFKEAKETINNGAQ